MEDEIDFHKENSFTSTSSPKGSSPINIPSRPSRSVSPFPHIPKMSLRSATPSPPIETSIDYNSSKQSIPEITFSNDISSETERHDSVFYRKLVIDISQPVGSMSISPSSRDIVLATRKGLSIIDLENPWQPPRELHHLTKWEVADVQWNPHPSRDTWVASTSNQKALIWNLSSAIQHEHILHAHNRAISDINWHPFNPNMLATSSVDTYVHLWDLKTPKKPAKSFCAWIAGATQVKFNKKNEFILASAHGKDLYIWDTRKGSLPITNINAHTTKIYGIDWSRSNADNIITCSLDQSVKFWNIQEPDACQGVIHTNSPVWRARHTPVGNGILIMPQRSEKNLYLWNKENLQTRIHAFEGHKDVVKEFVWRVKSDGDPTIDNREFQLITWSKDKTLRFWPISDELLKAIGHERGRPINPTDQIKQTGKSTFTFRDPPMNNHSISPTLSTSTSYPPLRIISGSRANTNIPFRPSGASAGGGNIKGYMVAAGMLRRSLLWMQNVRMVKPSGEIGNTEYIPENMHEEIAVVSKKFSNVEIEKLDMQGRNCTISLHGSRHAFIRINVKFPPQYPNRVSPIFDIQKTGMISIYNRTRMLNILRDIARSCVSQNRPCLEACIRYLLGEHTQEDGQERYGKDDSDDENYINATRRTSYDKSLNYILGDKEDYNVPFPKLCGTKFCASGKLVCFFSSLRSPDASNNTRNNEKTSYTYTHPRSYDSWEQYRMISQLPRPITRYGGDDDDSYNEVDDDSNVLLSFHPYLKNDLQDNVNPSNSLALFQSTKWDRYAVHIYDFSEWMPISQKLAKEYIIHGDDPVEICKYNAQVAADNNRPDLKQVWVLASLILSPTKFKNSLSSDEIILTNKRREIGNEYDSFMSKAFHGFFELGFHPFGRSLVKDLLNHFSSVGDIQTAAMLSCVFRQPFPPHRKDTRTFQPLASSELIAGNNISNMFNYVTNVTNGYGATPYGITPPTPSGYTYGQSEGSGIMVPHASHHQRRSTFGGTSKESSMFPSNITASPPRTPKKGSPATGGPNNKLDGWTGNEKPVEISDKKSCGLIFTLELEEFDDEKRPVQVSLLDDKIETNLRYDQFRLAYAELLYHWGLFEARAELLKFMRFVKTTVGSPLGELQEPLEIDIYCSQCKSELKGAKSCANCRSKKNTEIELKGAKLCINHVSKKYREENDYHRRAGIKCSICHRIVKGLSNFCMFCFHGGHTKHIHEWFEGNNECPTGCGCQCKIRNCGF
ncbi:WD repeat protein [Rhizophagus clarus]|uniref:WD repeat protein n=1 Tax=Rhizophagus clarus TaxID=94130 RepID=A0A8H3KXH1_9GLOM|nr:WD repeat protein [Rhizophagus clarus]